MNRQLVNFVLWVLIVLLLLAVFTLFQDPVSRPVAPVAVPAPQDGPHWLTLLISWLPFIFLVGAWILLSWWNRRSRSGSFGTGLPLSAKTLDDPAHWRDRAAEARATAERFTDAQSKRRLLEIAERYEYLAQQAEERRRASGSLS